MKKINTRIISLIALLLTVAMLFTGCGDLLADLGFPIGGDTSTGDTKGDGASDPQQNVGSFESLNDIPPFSGSPYVILNNNQPKFNENELVTQSYETYSELDSLGRCGIAMACVGIDIMPTEDRGNIGSVTPSGWQSVKYDIVDGKYLYNRCHLIGFQLTGENANKQNLITGTRYMNVEGMLPFENMVADYVKETENHVMLRVTPVFDGNNLVASGVIMEAYSVEDNGEEICFNVYIYNAQPGITIDYATGLSALGDNASIEAPDPSENEDNTNEEYADGEGLYILNTNTKKFHYPTCSSATSMTTANKKEFTGARDSLIAQGYSACGQCKP